MSSVYFIQKYRFFQLLYYIISTHFTEIIYYIYIHIERRTKAIREFLIVSITANLAAKRLNPTDRVITVISETLRNLRSFIIADSVSRS